MSIARRNSFALIVGVACLSPATSHADKVASATAAVDPKSDEAKIIQPFAVDFGPDGTPSGLLSVFGVKRDAMAAGRGPAAAKIRDMV